MTTMVGPRRSRAEGERLVEEFERSGQGLGAFCAARALSVNTLNYWRTKLGQEGVRSSFVELEPVASVGGGWEMELALGDGVVLRLRRGA